MHSKSILKFAVALLIAAAAEFAAAHSNTSLAADAVRAKDEVAIREAAQAFAQAFEKGDAKAIGTYFTEEGEYVEEDGEPVRGREALAKAYADFFAKRAHLRAECKTDKVRFLSKDTAVEEGTFTVHATGAPPHASRYSALHVRQDGRWLIALLKEWGDDTTDEPSLDDLAWLIGAWECNGDYAQAKTEYEWADNKKFIHVRYTVELTEDGKAIKHSGTQVMGIDPALGVVRAWTFDSEGGIGEAHWLWDGDRWVIDSGGTQPDGSTTTALSFLTRAGDDEFTWRSVKRTHDGEELPDLAAITVKRVKK